MCAWRKHCKHMASLYKHIMGKLQSATTLIQRHESTTPASSLDPFCMPIQKLCPEVSDFGPKCILHYYVMVLYKKYSLMHEDHNHARISWISVEIKPLMYVCNREKAPYWNVPSKIQPDNYCTYYYPCPCPRCFSQPKSCFSSTWSLINQNRLLFLCINIKMLLY